MDKISSKKCSLDAVNQQRLDNHLVLYTPTYGPSTGTNGLGIEVVIQNGFVIKKGENDNSIPADGMVLSGSGLAKDWINDCIPEGTKVYFNEDDLSIELV